MMITIEDNELKKWPVVCMFLQVTHHDPDVRQVLFNDDACEGDRFRRGYFKIWESNYLHYKMEYTIINMEEKIMHRKLVWVQLFDTYQEFEATRVKVLQSVPADQQEGFNLN